ncbi:MAG TPA: YlmC/YmxH family sporulation protein [Limnochordia bacterium]
MQVRASELRLLDVINVTDGRRLGNVYDIDVDQTTGSIRALILPGAGGFFWWGRRTELEIPWERVVRIGIDVILVDLPEGAAAYPR